MCLCWTENESAAGAHISPVFWMSFPVRSPQSSAESSSIQYAVTSYLFYTQYQKCVCVNPCLPIHPLLPRPLRVCTFRLQVCVSISVSQIRSSIYHFSRFRIHALIHNICFSLIAMAPADLKYILLKMKNSNISQSSFAGSIIPDSIYHLLPYYSWSLNNKGLNCVGPLGYRFFPINIVCISTL